MLRNTETELYYTSDLPIRSRIALCARTQPHDHTIKEDSSQPTTRSKTQLTAADLIYPIFLIEGDNTSNSSLHAQRQPDDNDLFFGAHRADLGIPVMAIFPVVRLRKRPEGSEAYHENGLVQQPSRR